MSLPIKSDGSTPQKIFLGNQSIKKLYYKNKSIWERIDIYTNMTKIIPFDILSHNSLVFNVDKARTNKHTRWQLHSPSKGYTSPTGFFAIDDSLNIGWTDKGEWSTYKTEWDGNHKFIVTNEVGWSIADVDYMLIYIV